MVQALDELGDQEEQRAQAEQREGVRREHDEAVGGDREDRRDRVDGEDEVDDRDGHQRGSRGGEDPPPVLPAGEPALRGYGGDRQPGGEPPHELLLGVVVAAVTEHAPARPDEEAGEDEVDPAERAEDGRADQDEDEPQHERADDAVAQQAMTLGDRHAERGEDEQEDEDVVQGQRLLDEVAGEVRAGVLGVPDQQQHAEEGERDAQPREARHGGQPEAHLAAAAADDEQVDRQEDDDRDGEAEPGRGGGRQQVGHSGAAPSRVTGRVMPRRFPRRPLRRAACTGRR